MTNRHLVIHIELLMVEHMNKAQPPTFVHKGIGVFGENAKTGLANS
jgi:hypothetical protein